MGVREFRWLNLGTPMPTTSSDTPPTDPTPIEPAYDPEPGPAPFPEITPDPSPAEAPAPPGTPDDGRPYALGAAGGDWGTQAAATG